MPASSPGNQQHGLPIDDAARQRIRGGLSDAEKEQFDDIVDKIGQGKAPDRNQRKFIRKLKQQGKIKESSKSFRSPSDKKTHQEP